MVEMVGFCQVLWIVMLKYTKDRMLGVDIPGQHVPLHVRYGMTYLLIRDAGCESCSTVWGKGTEHDRIHKVQEGLESRGNLSTASGDPSYGKTIAKHD
jgi:hypothetical protein